MFNFGGGDGFNLGNAHGKIIIDASGVSSAIRSAQRDMDNGLQSIGRSVSNLGSQFQNVGAQLTLLTAPIIAFGAQGVQAAARFEDALKEIEVRAGLTTDQLEQVRGKALEIGRDTQFSAGQGVEAFLQLLTAGQSVEEAFATIDSVIMGAASSGEELGFVSDGLTDIMAALNLRVEDVGGVVQAMSDAAASSSAEFRDLVMGFQNLGGAANQFNIPMREQAAILALFSENGIKGAEAGTQLRSMLRAMSSDTTRTKDAWERLGTSMFDATGAARPLGDVMEDIRVGLAGMTDEQRTRTIQDLAGSFGQLGLIALTSGDSIEDMLNTMSNGADVADVAAARMDTFSGAVAFLRGSIETFQINTLTPFLNDVLRPMVMRVAELINAFDAWGQENPELRNTIVGLAAAAAALGPALLAIGTALKIIGPIIGIVGTGMKALGVVAGVIASPIGLVAGAVLAVVAALDALGIIDVGAIFNTIKNTIGGFISDISEGGSLQGAIHNALINLFGPELGSEMSAEFNRLFGPLIQSIGDFVLAIQNGVNPIDAALNEIGDLFGQEVEQGIVDIIDDVKQAWTDFQDIIEGAGVVIGVALTAVRDWFVVEAMPKIEEFIKRVSNAWEGLQRGLMALWDAAKPFLQPIVDWFRDTFQWIGINYVKPVLDFINNIITEAERTLELLRLIGGGAPAENPNVIPGRLPPKPYTTKGFDSGGMIGAGDLALIGKGAQPEAFVAPRDGMMIPNFDKVLQGMGGGLTINSLTIQANSYAEGAAAAEGFDARMRQLRRSRDF